MIDPKINLDLHLLLDGVGGESRLSKVQGTQEKVAVVEDMCDRLPALAVPPRSLDGTGY